jgi:hypothetical protein
MRRVGKKPRKLRDLNFKVTEEFHRAFKMQAASLGVSMKALLGAALESLLRERSKRLPPTDDPGC